MIQRTRDGEAPPRGWGRGLRSGARTGMGTRRARGRELASGRGRALGCPRTWKTGTRARESDNDAPRQVRAATRIVHDAHLVRHGPCPARRKGGGCRRALHVRVVPRRVLRSGVVLDVLRPVLTAPHLLVLHVVPRVRVGRVHLRAGLVGRGVGGGRRTVCCRRLCGGGTSTCVSLVRGVGVCIAPGSNQQCHTAVRHATQIKACIVCVCVCELKQATYGDEACGHGAPRAAGPTTKRWSWPARRERLRLEPRGDDPEPEPEPEPLLELCRCRPPRLGDPSEPPLAGL